MPPLGPVKHKELVRALRRLGFSGPHAGGKHHIMQRGNITLILPNPHGRDISVGLLKRLLRQGGIKQDEWERA